MANCQYTLYFHPISYYSMKAVLALHHKEIDFKHVYVDIHGGDVTPEYLRLNPEGKIPTLKHGETIVTESDDIIDYIDKHCTKGVLLVPDVSTAHGQEVQQFRRLINDIPIENITYGILGCPDLAVAPRVQELPGFMRILFTPARMRRMLQGKIKEATEKAEKEPQLRDFWLGKKKYLEDKTAIVFNRSAVSGLLDDLESVFDQLAEQLMRQESRLHSNTFWLIGDTYTAADVVVTILFKRLDFVGIGKRYASPSKRPLCFNYQQRLFATPAFKKTMALRKYYPLISLRSKLPAVSKVAGAAIFIGVAAYLFRKYDFIGRLQGYFK